MRNLHIFIVIAVLSIPVFASEHGTAINREQALMDLRAGNERYVSGKPHAWNATAAKRDELAGGQHPQACIITCSDSRVSPEILFDESIGDLFVVRLAGNVVTAEVTGSVEYAVDHLHVPVVVVLGHSSCGAIAAALSGDATEGPVNSVLNRLKPAIDAAKQKGFSGDNLPSASINENARQGAEMLVQSSRVIEEAVRNGSVTVLSAVYDIKTGQVSWQTQLAAPVTALPVAAAAAAPAETPAKKAEAVSAKVETDAPKAASAHSDKTPPKKSGSGFGGYARRH